MNDTSVTRMRDKQHRSYTSVTQVLQKNTSAKRVLHKRNECDTSEKF